MINTPFSTHLSNLRTNARLTNKELASLARVPRSLIAGLQSGKRQIGEYQARKIATALKLQEPELANFIYAAINNCAEKVLVASKGYPAELLNLIAGQLFGAGISSESIYHCQVAGDEYGQDVTLTLGNGSKALLKTQLVLP